VLAAEFGGVLWTIVLPQWDLEWTSALAMLSSPLAPIWQHTWTFSKLSLTILTNNQRKTLNLREFFAVYRISLLCFVSLRLIHSDKYKHTRESSLKRKIDLEECTVENTPNATQRSTELWNSKYFFAFSFLLPSLPLFVFPSRRSLLCRVFGFYFMRNAMKSYHNLSLHDTTNPFAGITQIKQQNRSQTEDAEFLGIATWLRDENRRNIFMKNRTFPSIISRRNVINFDLFNNNNEWRYASSLPLLVERRGRRHSSKTFSLMTFFRFVSFR
jgi:hypothetical protein